MVVEESGEDFFFSCGTGDREVRMGGIYTTRNKVVCNLTYVQKRDM